MIATRILRLRLTVVRFFTGMSFTSTFLFIQRARHVGDPLEDSDRREERGDGDGHREELKGSGDRPGGYIAEVGRDPGLARRDAKAGTPVERLCPCAGGA